MGQLIALWRRIPGVLNRQVRSHAESQKTLRWLGYQIGGIRPSAVVVLAVALMVGGVLIAIQSMAVDDEMRASYEEALALSQLALETQHSSAALRNLQGRVARGLTQTPVLSPTPDIAGLRQAITAMAAKLDEIQAFRLSSAEQTRLIELKRALAEVEDVNGQLLDAARREDMAIETARRLVALSQQRSESFERSLSELVSAVRLRTLSAARSADQLNTVARYALITFPSSHSFWHCSRCC